MTDYPTLELKAALAFWRQYHSIGGRVRLRRAIADYRRMSLLEAEERELRRAIAVEFNSVCDDLNNLEQQVARLKRQAAAFLAPVKAVAASDGGN